VLFSLGQQRTSATHAGLVMALLPVLTGLFAALGARQWPAGRWLLGAGIAFVGAVWLIALRGDSGTAQASAAGDLLVLASSVAASAGYVIGATQAQRIGTLPVALWSVLLGGVVLLPVAVLVWPAGTLARATPAGWLSLLYLALCSSLLAYGLWYWALAAGGVARIGTTQFLQPLVTIALAALLLGERMSAGQGLATAAVLFGVLVCLQARAAAVQRAAPQAMQMGGT
jgi:drug/metabolite transporter (DMT)-like permease